MSLSTSWIDAKNLQQMTLFSMVHSPAFVRSQRTTLALPPITPTGSVGLANPVDCDFAAEDDLRQVGGGPIKRAAEQRRTPFASHPIAAVSPALPASTFLRVAPSRRVVSLAMVRRALIASSM